MTKSQRQEIEDLRLYYDLSKSGSNDTANSKSYESLKKLCEEVGVYLDVRDNRLVLSVFPAAYIRKRCRNAGRRRVVAWKRPGLEAYRFSDVVYLLREKNDREMIEILNMPQATYYRHKKNLRMSSYYKKLDKDRLGEKEYLKSVEGDLIF